MARAGDTKEVISVEEELQELNPQGEALSARQR